ncbi:cyclic nucleotide-binding domain-containing protein [Limnothrix redekei]|uniref:Cyclic nucleotide-binding domain-containing protein n=1 Tax=Limnothrix redekei LRLZ20PSL1 TaxID=3112953 RepID=A0ABW7CCT2_9CYAN
MNWLKPLQQGLLDLLQTPLFQLGETVISLGFLLQLVLYSALVYGGARIIKGFLQNRLLAKLRIDEGNRGPIAGIVSYSGGVLIFIMLLQSAGFNLNSLAVPAGALGVGVGLGLQNITKNFVGGLNLLLERKLRVGDFIEFDGLAGHVVEVALRSAVIRTLDGAHVIVPNSDLVEKRVINWHYNNLAARLHIKVSVAYSSDPLVVTELLLDVAYSESMVLDDPAPTVILLGLGDHGLDFDLRVWIRGYEREFDARHALNCAIEYRFHQQGIEIPFPQRDLWLRNPEVLYPLGRGSDPTAAVPLAPLAQRQIPSETRSSLLTESLKRVHYFSHLNDLDLRRVIECGYRQRLKPDEILFREGDPGNSFYIVLSGSVKVFVAELDKHLTDLAAGSFFGELALMLGIPRTATVSANEETLLFAINQQGFTELLRKHPPIAEVIVRELSVRQEELRDRQAQLRALGLIAADEDDSNPVQWVRKRIARLFDLGL